MVAAKPGTMKTELGPGLDPPLFLKQCIRVLGGRHRHAQAQGQLAQGRQFAFAVGRAGLDQLDEVAVHRLIGEGVFLPLFIAVVLD